MTYINEIQPEEYNEYYGYHIKKNNEDVDLLEALTKGLSSTISFFESLPDDKLLYRYAEGKWTPKEVLLHLIDTERIFIYRALRFSRNDKTSLMGFEQDDFMVNNTANERTIPSLLEEYKATRVSSIAVFQNMNVTSSSLIGTASGSPMSARAAGFIICGHEIHHIEIIKEKCL